MALQIIDHGLADITLERVSGFDYEKFVRSFCPKVAKFSFVPPGGARDGGADGPSAFSAVESEAQT